MKNRKIIILGACAVGLIVVGLFYACKKDSNVINQKEVGVKERFLIGAMSENDTIYIPNNLPKYCELCDDCWEKGGCCLPEFRKKWNPWEIKNVQEVFDAIIKADDNPDADKIKREIIKNNEHLFAEFINKEWLSQIENGTGYLSCIQKNGNRYVFSLSLTNTIFMIGEKDYEIAFDNLILPVLLIEEEENLLIGEKEDFIIRRK